MELSIIAAIGKNNELGKNNDLLWKLKDDMRFFKNMTIGNKVVMGRKTFESLPGLLKDRKHIVLTRSGLEFPKEVEVFHDVSSFLEKYKTYDGEIFDIGGASIYRELLEYADNLYLTEIDDTKEADVYFPYFNKEDYDRKELCSHQEGNISFKHVLYKRR
ncbi:MAG: dihydrofolate reductase [Bacilli bacterium]|nr:dihydrofolate reductase [Bacilli bacterium]